MIDSNMIGKVISFTPYASVVFDNTFKRCKVLGLLDADSAKHYIDVARVAVAIYPALPKNTPTDYRKFIYIKIKLSNGDVTCLANEWIKQDTVVVHEDVTASFTVGSINASDVERIRSILASHNYLNVVTKVD